MDPFESFYEAQMSVLEKAGEAYIPLLTAVALGGTGGEISGIFLEYYQYHDFCDILLSLLDELS